MLMLSIWVLTPVIHQRASQQRVAERQAKGLVAIEVRPKGFRRTVCDRGCGVAFLVHRGVNGGR